MTGNLIPSRPLSIAHRGASAYAPENTIAAFRKAAELGADMWEADIRMTADNVPVVYHNAAISDGRLVKDMTLSELQDVAPACPTFDEVVALAVALQAGIYADIKDIDAAIPILKCLKNADITPVILGGFNMDVVQVLRQNDCPYPIAILVPVGADPHEYTAGADVMHLCWERLDEPEKTLTTALFLRAFATGQSVVLWHEEDPARMAALRVKPVMGICSDRPELVNPFKAPSGYPFGIVCHRGANKIAPENTLPALECALAAGFDYIEFDLHITTDNEIVVFHDPKLERTTNGHGPVCDHSLAELRKLDAGSWFDPFFAGTQIPTLNEVLELLKKYDGRAYLEFKSAPPELVLEAVKTADLLGRVFFWSFNRDYLVELRKISPTATIMARRQDYPSLDETIADFGANIVEFLPKADVFDVAALRGSAVKSMVAYNGSDTAVFDRILDMRPDLVNLNAPFAFGRHAGGFALHA